MPGLSALAECHPDGLWRRSRAGGDHAGRRATGEQEDRQGEPFVGAAGRLLRDALGRAGIDVSGVYLTNAVKHFKWRPQGKRRIHERPNREEILACRMWLIVTVHPSSILRAPDEAARHEAMALFVAHLKKIRQAARTTDAFIQPSA